MADGADSTLSPRARGATVLQKAHGPRCVQACLAITGWRIQAMSGALRSEACQRHLSRTAKSCLPS
jgi:hypothetical protein